MTSKAILDISELDKRWLKEIAYQLALLNEREHRRDIENQPAPLGYAKSVYRPL